MNPLFRIELMAMLADLYRRRATIIGRRYLEKGRPVTVLKKWGPGGGPRNVLIRREDGSEVVRPFRGLRKGGGR
jgi:acetyl esterase